MGDDFSDAVKRVLASRVGHLCSKPDCRALTSGPQEDSAKAVNLGVAAHITAASPGGPRYDSSFSPEQRSGHENGIWLCQNCAKHIDNDPAQFSVDVLRKWKSGAEAEAKDRVGKTATLIIRRRSDSIETIDALRAIQRGQKPDPETVERLHEDGLIEVIDVTHLQSPGQEYIPGLLTAKGLKVLGAGNDPVRAASFPTIPSPNLKAHDRVRISPIIPKEHEQSNFEVVEDEGDCFVFETLDSTRPVDIPKSFIEKIHSFGNSKPALVHLSGRLQWVSTRRTFELFPDKPQAGPAGTYGIPKDVDFDYPRRLGIAGSFAREDQLARVLGARMVCLL